MTKLISSLVGFRSSPADTESIGDSDIIRVFDYDLRHPCVPTATLGLPHRKMRLYPSP
jgi:hypothetical protein